MASETIERRMIWQHTGPFYLTVVGERPPTDAEWNAFLEHYVGVVHELKAVLVFSLGGSPNAAQRARLVAVSEKIYPRHVIVTDSALVRGVVTAISWFVPADRRATVFRLADIERAFAALRELGGPTHELELALARAREQVMPSSRASTGS